MGLDMNDVKGIEFVKHDDLFLAIIIRSFYKKSGIEFFTPPDFSQQLGYMNRPKGYVIEPHVHNEVNRTIVYTKEVLFVRSGTLKVDFYNETKDYISSRLLEMGDIILLAYGGHGFQFVEEGEVIEIKQGPYAGDDDKTRFVSNSLP